MVWARVSRRRLDGFYGGEKVEQLEGLGEVAYGFDFARPTVGVLSGGHYYYRELDAALFEGANEAPAIEDGHSHVKKDHAWAGSLDGVKAFEAVAGLLNGIA